MIKEKKNLNEVAIFNEADYKQGLERLNDNLQNFINMQDAFETITKSKEILEPIEVLNDFITKTSGFPNLQASISLMDWDTPYETIRKNIDTVDYVLFDLKTLKVPFEVTEAYREECTIRLSNEAQADYLILKEICKLYETITVKDTLHTIIASNNRTNFDVDVKALRTLMQLRELR